MCSSRKSLSCKGKVHSGGYSRWRRPGLVTGRDSIPSPSPPCRIRAHEHCAESATVRTQIAALCAAITAAVSRRWKVASQRLRNCLDADFRRLCGLAADADLGAAVPSCRGWTMTDLLHHFGEVYLDKTECMRGG